MKAGTYDFVSLYPTERILASSSKENSKKNANNFSKDDSNSSRSSFGKKNKRKSSIIASENEADTSGVGPKVSSTPHKNKTNRKSDIPVESILKNADAERSILRSSDKPKKRNKSVSFVLDDGEIAVATKKTKKSSNKPNTATESAEDNIESKTSKNSRKNKNKKKKKNVEVTETTNEVQAAEEPKMKKNKKQKLTENIAKNLENLSIGDNANTLAGLLDDLKVDDKTKKHKKKKNKTENTDVDDEADSNESEEHAQNTKKIHKKKNKKSKNPNNESTGEESEAPEKERVKWVKRKWNKDKKAEIWGDELHTTIVVENLPLSLILYYKKALTELFTKYGVIKKIGIVELYPTEEPRPVFTTTLQFNSEEAATQALEEDNMELKGGRIRVRRLLPPTETTVAVRCYRGCSQQHMSSIFAPCGKIRSIREILKGKASMPTAFVEFDGPEAVERALKVAQDARIGGKKVLVQRFEVRSGNKRKRIASESKEDKESDQEDGSS